MAEPGESLSERELAVLSRLIAGSTNREIAVDLDISPNTVKVHVRNIFTKLEVASRTEAATLAIQEGLVTVPGSDTGSGDASQAGEEIPPLELLDEPAEISIAPGPRRLPTWSWIAFIGILLAGLVVGSLAGDWLREVNQATESPRETLPVPTRFPIGDARWFEGDALPRARANMAVASVGLDLFVIGGEVDAGIINLVDILESDTRTWQPGSSKPTAVTEASAAVLFGEIIVPGGLLADGRPTAVVESYSPANNAWRPIAPIPKPVAGGLALSDGNTLYLFGGWDGETFLAEGYIYDPVEDLWSPIPAMTHARAGAAGGLVDNRLFVIGGRYEQQDLDVCEYYLPEEKVWHDCPPLTMPRSNAGAAPLANRFLYIFGGGLAGQESEGEVFDTLTDSWQSVEMPMFEEPVHWTGLGVTNIESQIFVIGGYQDDQLTSDGYVYSPLTNRTYLPAIGNQ